MHKEMSGFFQATAGVEQRLLAGNFNAHTEVVVRSQVFHHHAGKVMHVDYHLADSKAAQARERDLEQRAAVDFDQRFRAIVGEWAQARAKARGENHRLHGFTALMDSTAPGRDDARPLPLRLWTWRANGPPTAPPDRPSDAGRRCSRTTPSSA